MTEMAHGTVIVQSGEAVLSRWWRTVDRVALGCVIGLFAIGILLGFAASPPLADRNGLSPFHYVTRQAFFGTVAMAIMLVVSMMQPQTLRRLGVLGFAASFLAVMLLPLLGTDFGKGAVRWYSLGFASVQPSEFLKPCFVILTAWLVAASQELGGPPGKRISLAITITVILFLAAQPDFGQAALITASWVTIYFVAGAPLLLLSLFISGVLLFGYVAYNNSEHVARRIDGFLNPDVDPNTQMGFATNAIREGGFFGSGLNEGTVKWSLPDAHTDFIIAVAAEEYGLLLVFTIIGLFTVFTVRSLFRLMRERDPFTRLAGTGLATLFGLQAFINLGVAVRVLPAKGMTLPFVSYGGSSLIAMGILTGCLLCFTRSRPQGEIGDLFRRS